MSKVKSIYQEHHDFVLLFLLFVSFRWLTLLFYRPGGFIADFSDFYFYRAFAELTNEGYYPYLNLWSAYPPIFPWLVVAVYRLSILIPPWNDPSLWFNSILGTVLLLFEAGNLVLIYLLGREIYQPAGAVKVGWIYAGLFVPVYTLTGWFEGFPLFFLLLAVYLLIKRRSIWSGVVSAIGFMVKLLPLLVVPIALRILWIECRHRVEEGRVLPNRRFLIPLTYLATTLIVIALIAWPFWRLNPHLLFASPLMAAARPPWESVWALLEGNFTYGIIEADMRDLTSIGVSQTPSRLPWALITVAFGLIYLWLYGRPFDWQRKVSIIAFTALSLNLFVLYNRGYSPQFLVWLLPFLVLLMPDLRGVAYALVLSFVNMVEGTVYFIIFPQEHWLLVVTVLVRTVLILALCLEYYMILSNRSWSWAKRGRRILFGFLAGAFLLAIVPAGGRLAFAYFEDRYHQNRCREAIDYVRAYGEKDAVLVSTGLDSFHQLYPFLHDDFTLVVLDPYVPAGSSLRQRTEERLAEIAARYPEVWLVRENSTADQRLGEIAETWLRLNLYQASRYGQGPCPLAQFVSPGRTGIVPLGANLGGRVKLVGYDAVTEDGRSLASLGTLAIQPGSRLYLTLYWQGLVKMDVSYTVFVHFLDREGRRWGQKDGIPGQGTLLTTDWQPGQVIVDRREMAVAADAPAGPYTLTVGLYDAVTGQRLDVLDHLGNPQDTVVWLGGIEVR
ncbi:MAG: hypothetical protein ACE5NP_05875 [Anaerolineae bacterium]